MRAIYSSHWLAMSSRQHEKLGKDDRLVYREVAQDGGACERILGLLCQGARRSTP